MTWTFRLKPRTAEAEGERTKRMFSPAENEARKGEARRGERAPALLTVLQLKSHSSSRSSLFFGSPHYFSLIADEDGHREVDDGDAALGEGDGRGGADSPQPLVPIQSYEDRGANQALFKQNGKAKSGEKHVTTSQGLGRKSSFHEIQSKFKSLERRQKEETAHDEEQKKRVIRQAPKRSDIKRTNSRLSESDLATAQVLESYLNRKKDEGKAVSRSSSKARRPPAEAKAVRRQASRCSSAAMTPAPDYRRGMEAVEDFEKVWAWADDAHMQDDLPPLTRELGSEFQRRGSPRHRGVSPAMLPPGARRQASPSAGAAGGRRSRLRTPEGLPAPPPQRLPRGLSSPAAAGGEFQRHHHHHPPAFFSAAAVGASNLIRRRAASPEVTRRNSSIGQERPALRRERTSLFDNRYPSLDSRSDRRRGAWEQEMEARRRSYHELGQLPPPHPPPHFKKPSAKEAKKMQKQMQQQAAAMAQAAAAAVAWNAAAGYPAPPHHHLHAPHVMHHPQGRYPPVLRPY